MVEYHRVGINDDPATQKSAANKSKGPPKGEWHFQMLFFVAAICSILSGMVGVVSFMLVPLAPIFEFLDFADELYLIFFGMILFVLDAPLNFRWVLETKLLICRYCRLLTRYTGKGLFLIFLSCTSFSAMYLEEILQTTSIFLSIYMAALGTVCVLAGVSKTVRLNRVRLSLQNKGTDEMQAQYILGFCQMLPNQAITQEEFAAMARSMDPRVNWSPAELRQITAALSCETGPDGNLDIVKIEHMLEWLRPGLPVMM